MSVTIWTYLLYLTVSVALTIWVAQTLFRSGRIFLVDIFGGRETLADSVNHLLVVGFYLVNLGYIALALKLAGNVGSLRVGIEAFAGKVGGVLLILGLMHFFNLFVFSRLRKRSRLHSAPPPVRPDAALPVR